MKDIYSRRGPPADWVVPEGLLVDLIDEKTGFRATAFCPGEDVSLLYFIPGTEPREFCPIHTRALTSPDTGGSH
jgi:hypothetical protein